MLHKSPGQRIKTEGETVCRKSLFQGISNVYVEPNKAYTPFTALRKRMPCADFDYKVNDQGLSPAQSLEAMQCTAGAFSLPPDLNRLKSLVQVLLLEGPLL